LRFPEFKGEWEDKKLGDLCSEFKSGKNIKSAEILEDGKFPVFGGNGLRGFTHKYNYNGEYVIVGRQGALCGNVRLVEGKCYMTEHAIVIQGSEDNNTKFLLYLLDKLNLGQYSDQSAQPGLAVNKLQKIKVTIPNLSEQNKIASFLFLLDQRIKTQIKIIEKYESLIKGIRYYILEESTHYDYLGNLCDIIKGQQVNLDNLLKHGKYYVMNGGTQPSGYYNSYNTDAGTISISEGGNSCGYVQYNKENFWSGGHCYTLQNIENELTEKYLYHYLKSNEKKIMALRVGSGLPNIQKKDLMSLRIPIPAKENQKKISCLLDSIEDKISIETNMLKHDIRQKNYLLRQMFI
jgi:type I restriction enzyme S subunit